MKWITTFFKHSKPSVCFAMFHFPKSLFIECDCVNICKWPPKGHPDALPIIKPDFHKSRKVAIENTICASLKVCGQM